MRAALYYPYTEVRSEQLVRMSLLLWDSIECIVPYRKYRPNYPDKKVAKAMEIIGKCHCPDNSEKRAAHQFVEEFATGPLPAACYYSNLRRNNEEYELWPQKFMYETWQLLESLQLVGKRWAIASDYPTTTPVGLCLMSILAECCAGETRARITDQGLAYATLSNMLIDEQKPDTGDAYETIVPLTLKLLNISDIPIEKLISFREREAKEAHGHTLTELRHNYLSYIEEYVSDVSKLDRKRDQEERTRIFESDMSNHLKELV
jgi:hypothetical protein